MQTFYSGFVIFCLILFSRGQDPCLYKDFCANDALLKCKSDKENLPTEHYHNIYRVCHLKEGHIFEEKRRCKPGFAFCSKARVCKPWDGVQTECPKKIWLPQLTLHFKPTDWSESGIRSRHCVPYRKPLNCSEGKFSDVSGVCHNPEKPNAGAAFIPLRRLLPQKYENQEDAPRGWNVKTTYQGYSVPSARLISNVLMAFPSDSEQVESNITELFMSFGQFAVHDFSFTTINELKNFSVQDCDTPGCGKNPCFPIEIPEHDMNKEPGYIPFTRSQVMCEKADNSPEVEPYEQVNTVTSWLDLSMVYGSSESELLALSDKPYLKNLTSIYKSNFSKGLLPLRDNMNSCKKRFDVNQQVHKQNECFLAGDKRVNENLGLIALHTIFMREHNRIVNTLKELTKWTSEKLFQVARKISIAVWQNIVYNDYLKLVLGDGWNELGNYSFDSSFDGSVTSEFSTAASRFGHAQISNNITRFGSNYGPFWHGNLSLVEAFHAPDRLWTEKGIDPLLRGMLATPVKTVKPGRLFHDAVRNDMFGLNQKIALDLASINIQRGRDHGFPTFMEYRRLYHFTTVSKWVDFYDDPDFNHLSKNYVNKIMQLYGHPENIELFVGGFLENPGNGLVGKTFRKIWLEGFKALRDGDRYWYENPNMFNSNQLAEIKRHSLSRLICDNGDDIKKVPRRAFGLEPITNFVECEKVDAMSLANIVKEMT